MQIIFPETDQDQQNYHLPGSDLLDFYKMKLRKYLTILFIGAMHLANAQSRPETGLWFTVQAPVNFSKHWQWFNDAGYRTYGISASAIQYYYRTAARYHFNKQWSTSAGIAFFFTKTDFDKEHHEFGREFRFWEEAAYQHLLNENLLGMFRIRPEQRFFAATSDKDKYHAFRVRLRPGLNQKLDEHWSLQLTDEYMQQLVNDKFSFNQNRLTFSGIYHFNKTNQLQVGYLWLKFQKESQHILTFQFTKNISWHGD